MISTALIFSTTFKNMMRRGGFIPAFYVVFSTFTNKKFKFDFLLFLA